MTIHENIELRLTLSQEDPLYDTFVSIKNSLGIKSNSEVARFIIKQISKVPVSNLIIDFMRDGPESIEEEKPTKKEGKKND